MVLAFMVGLIFLSNYVTPIHAQPDDFPIGMNLHYITTVFQPPPSQFDYHTIYNFTQWIDQDGLLVEYGKDSALIVDPFHEIRLNLPEQPLLWMNVSTWQLYDVIEMSGFEYRFVLVEDMFFGALGDIECIRLEYILESGGLENATSLWYHSQLGILLDYLHSVTEIGGSALQIISSFILESNFDQFNPPTFTVPEPTQTTSTTTPTTPTMPISTTTAPIPTTTPYPTSSTTSVSGPLVGLTEILAIGIFTEILVIIAIIRSKGK